MACKFFRLKHQPMTDDAVTTAEHIVRLEQSRRAAAFERAFDELDRPHLSTETILDLYVAEVTR